MRDEFFFNDPATTEISTLSLHDALPIFVNDAGATTGPVTPTSGRSHATAACRFRRIRDQAPAQEGHGAARSEEHMSRVQSRQYLVRRLLLVTIWPEHPSDGGRDGECGPP